MKHVPLTILLMWATGLAAGDEGIDSIELDEDVISGNEELPRVLYILPWRELPGEPVEGRPPSPPSAWLEPIYPDEHRRRLRLREALSRTSDSLKEE